MIQNVGALFLALSVVILLMEVLCQLAECLLN